MRPRRSWPACCWSGWRGNCVAGIVVIWPAADVVNGSSWFSRLLADIRSCGADIIVAGPPQGPDPIQRAAQAQGPEGVEEASRPEQAYPADGSPPRLLGGRPAAWGEHCLHRACGGDELDV